MQCTTPQIVYRNAQIHLGACISNPNKKNSNSIYNRTTVVLAHLS